MQGELPAHFPGPPPGGRGRRMPDPEAHRAPPPAEQERERGSRLRWVPEAELLGTQRFGRCRLHAVAGGFALGPAAQVGSGRGRPGCPRVPRRGGRRAPGHLDEAGSADPVPGRTGVMRRGRRRQEEGRPRMQYGAPPASRAEALTLTRSSGTRRQHSSRGGGSGAGGWGGGEEALRPRRRAEDARRRICAVPARPGTYGEDGG